MKAIKVCRNLFVAVIFSWCFARSDTAHALSDENRTYLALGVVAVTLLLIDTSGRLSLDSQERQPKSPFPRGFEPFAVFERETGALKTGIRYGFQW